MKKILGMALAALVAFGAFGAIAEKSDTVTLGGVVAEVTDSTALINTAEYGDVLVSYDDTTAFVNTENGIEVGAYVIVSYSGVMTRSIPPQIFATQIEINVISGTVVEVSDAGALVEEASSRRTFVSLTEEMPTLFYGCPVDVYFSGVMTASDPGQIEALHVVTPTLPGTITELNDGYFLMTAEDGRTYMANNDDGTHLDGALNVGDDIYVYYTGAASMSDPPQIYTIAVFHVEE